MPLPMTAPADLAGTGGRLVDFDTSCQTMYASMSSAKAITAVRHVCECWQRSSTPDVQCITASASFVSLVQSKLFAAMSYAKHYNTITQLF